MECSTDAWQYLLNPELFLIKPSCSAKIERRKQIKIKKNSISRKTYWALVHHVLIRLFLTSDKVAHVG